MKLDKKLTLELKKITILAGKEILKIYRKPFKKNLKADKSPITEADIAANNIICERLKKLTPNIPIISEENENRPGKSLTTASRDHATHFPSVGESWEDSLHCVSIP